MKRRNLRQLAACLLFLFPVEGMLSAGVAPPAGGQAALAQSLRFKIDPQRSKINWTLGATAHTVRGTFNVKNGELVFDLAAGKVTGEVVALATSGASGNAGRDEKMHKQVLESRKFADIVFRLDRFEGKISPAGKSLVQLHGMLALHGAEHEMAVSTEAEINGSDWTGSTKFSVPYVAWGLKNPGNFFLRVSKSVDVDLTLAGKLE